MSRTPAGEPLRRRVLRRQRPRVIGSALCLMGHQSCEALVPVAIGIAIDTAVVSGRPSLLMLCLAGLILLFTALTTCYRWYARFGQGAVIDESHALRAELAARVLSPGGPRRRHGELLTIASSDADQSTHSVIWVAGLCGAGAALAVSGGVLLSIDLRLGAVLILTAVTVTLALNALSPLISRRVLDQQRTLAGASALATDLVTGLRVVHGLGAQATATERYRAVSRTAETAGIRAGTANSLQRGASVLGATIVLAVSVAFAGVLALRGEISVGAFVAAVGVAQFISEPLTGIGSYLQIGAASKASAGRVQAVLTAETEPTGPDAAGATAAPDAATEPAPTGSGPADAAAGPARIEVGAGELLGIIAEPAEVDGVIAALAPPQGLRMHVEPHRADLFAGSIAQNLALGRTAAAAAGAATGAATGSSAGEPREDPSAAVDAAGAREFVDAQPAGLDEQVRDRGLSLSGGQRQRLALARALHADPELLVLIDPTTAVDPMTEEGVAEGLRGLRHDDGAARTTVVITSSPVLLARTDRVVMLRGADAPLVGTHRELLAREGLYRKKVLG